MIYVIRDYKTKYKTDDMKGKDLTDLCILKCLGAYLGSDGSYSVVRDESGKPYIKELMQRLHISVSHSEDVFMCAFAPVNIGFDLQFMRKANFESLSKRYYSLHEQDHVERNGARGFFEVWVKKEAYAKYTGAGLKDVLGGACTFHLDDMTFVCEEMDNEMFVCLCFEKGSLGPLRNLKTIEI